MTEEGEGSSPVRSNAVKWICGAVVVLGLFLLVGVLALGTDSPFKVQGSFQGATFTFDLSGAQDVGELLDALLVEEADSRKRAAVVDALARHGFIDVANDPVRLQDALEALTPTAPTVARLRGMMCDLDGPFGIDQRGGPLVDAGADFARAIYRLEPDHALVQRLVSDFLEGRSFRPPDFPARIVPDPGVDEMDIAICEDNPLRDYNDAQIMRIDAARNVIGRLEVRTNCREADLVRVHPVTWRRLGGEGWDGVLDDALLSPLRIGTFYLAENHARLCRGVDGAL